MGAPDTLTQGLTRPIAQTQQVFRGLLQALSQPGTAVTCTPGVEQAGLMPATAAALLSLTDHDTPVWWAPRSAQPWPVNWLRFHTGAASVDVPEQARFAVISGPMHTVRLADFHPGDDMQPEQSCTVLWQVESLQQGPASRWSGPGIRGHQRVRIEGLPVDFWQQWALNHARFPQGVDVILVCGAQWMGLPRSTRVDPLEEC